MRAWFKVTMFHGGNDLVIDADDVEYVHDEENKGKRTTFLKTRDGEFWINEPAEQVLTLMRAAEQAVMNAEAHQAIRPLRRFGE